MNTQDTRSLEKFAAPLGGEVELLELSYEGGVKLLRVRIRQGSRFTDLDLDQVTAKHWGAAMTAWAGTGAEAEAGS